MPVPDFQSMMLPFLQCVADGADHDLRQIRERIAHHFSLTQTDREETLPSGNQTRLENRVGWCRTHLYKAGLIERVRRGVFRITARGTELLASKPPALNLKYLDQFPEHKTWFHAEPSERDPFEEVSSLLENATPEEQFEALATTLRETLISELLEKLRAMEPLRFERVVLDVLLAMGYGGSRKEAAEAGKGVNDGGIDGLINEDRLGLDRIYVQAKRWNDTVQRPAVQSFVGALSGHHASKGIFITTSEFSSGAHEFVRTVQQRVILIDGQRLAELMIEHNIGVSRAYAFEMKRVDSDYFEES